MEFLTSTEVPLDLLFASGGNDKKMPTEITPNKSAEESNSDDTKCEADMNWTDDVKSAHRDMWIERYGENGEFKSGLTIEFDEMLEADMMKHERQSLDIAAGAQVYMEKQMVHVAAVAHLPMYLLWKLLWLVVRSPLYAPSVVKPTLCMPVLLFRKKWVLSRMSSYLYIRCSATSLKAYGKIWLTPGNWLNIPAWLAHFVNQPCALLCCQWRRVFGAMVIRPLKWSSHLFKRPAFYVQTKTEECSSPEYKVGKDSKLFHDVNLSDPTEFPILVKYGTRYKLYKAFPNRLMSRAWGSFNTLVLPVWLRSWAFRLYIWMFGCKLDEADITDLKQYKNLREFFTRKLKPGSRQIHGTHSLVSPADGTVLYCGKVEDDTLEQIKGVRYSMQSFMGPLTQPVFNISPCSSHTQKLIGSRSDSTLIHLEHRNGTSLSKRYLRSCSACVQRIQNCSECFGEQCSECVCEHLQYRTNDMYTSTLRKNPCNELRYCIIYLAPGDYHRFHSPAEWTVFSRRHFSGELFSVKPAIARWLQGLFCINERAMYVGEWRHGFFSFTAVGATNVGSIHVSFDEDLETSCKESGHVGFYEDKSFRKLRKNKGVKLSKGQDIGHFNLGSTIVLVFEAPPSFKLNLKPGQKVKYGQSIGTCSSEF